MSYRLGFIRSRLVRLDKGWFGGRGGLEFWVKVAVG